MKEKDSGARFVDVRLCGTVPLMIHNPQLANPMNSWSRLIKEITGKRKKTEKDYADLMELEFNGGLYHNDEVGPYMPDTWIMATIENGAKKHKKGMAKEVLSALDVEPEIIPIEYNGPRGRKELFADQRFVDYRSCVIKGQRVMRCRAKFPHPWFVGFRLTILADVLNVEDVGHSLKKAGIYCGLGTYRPKYGRFAVEVFREV